MTREELNTICEIVRDLANEHFGDWEQSCKFEDLFRNDIESRCDVLDQDTIPTEKEMQRIALEKYPDFPSTQVLGYVETNLHRTPFLEGMRHLKSIIINSKTV